MSSGNAFPVLTVANPEVEVVKVCQPQTAIQLKWLKTRMKRAAPQALVVAS
jgi:hypothetical protein